MNNDYEIYIGSKENPTYYFDNDTIMNLSSETTVNMVMEELSVDTLTFSVLYEFIESNVFKPTDYDAFESSEGEILCTYGNSNIAGIGWGTPVILYTNYVFTSKFYVNSIKRVGINQYDFECVSYIGLLDQKTYYGNMYVSENTFLLNNISRILLSNGINQYSAFEYIKVYGRSYAQTTLYDSYGDLSQKLITKIKFKYDGISEELTNSESLAAEITILGYEYDPSYETGHSYIVKAPITRSTRSSPWSNPTINLYYGSQIIQGVTLVKGTTYEIEINPVTEKFIINDVEFPFNRSSFSFLYNQLFVCIASKFEQHESYGGINYGNWEGIIYNFSFTKDGETVNFVPAVDLSQTPFRKCYAQTTSQSWLYPQCFILESYTTSKSTFGNSINIGTDISKFSKLTEAETDVINNIEFDDTLTTLQIQGWIPICSRREALQQVLLASGINLIKSDTGKLLFTWIYDTDETIPITDNEIFDTGDITYEAGASLIELTEHTFVNSSEDPITVYDNSSGTAVTNYIVRFENPPMRSGGYRTTGNLTAHFVNSNCAVVSGTGTLEVRECMHSTRTISYIPDTVRDGQKISVSDATMITQQNSSNMIERLASYYSDKQIITNSILGNSVICGRKYSFNNKFKELTTGYLRKKTTKVSNILKSACEYVGDYHPAGLGGGFTNSVLLTGDGTWTVPSFVFEKPSPKIKVVLIGGGEGGASGYAGANGTVSPSLWVGEEISSGEGGQAGKSGNGGNVFQTIIYGNNIQSSYQYSCGDGGNGGTQCTSHTVSNAGESGNPTTFGTYTSANGTYNPNGIVNFLNGYTYAKSPENYGRVDNGDMQQYGCSIQGQDGGFSTDSEFGVIYGYCLPWYLLDTGRYRLDVLNGADENTAFLAHRVDGAFYVPNQLRKDYHSESAMYSWNFSIDGGFAGGGALGHKGNDGTTSSQVGNPCTIQLGSGGNGADADQPITIDEYAFITYNIYGVYGNIMYPYGFGGFGGNGGGGGGSSGCGANIWDGSATFISGTAGIGGKGSAGGKGAKGCVIVYY